MHSSVRARAKMSAKPTGQLSPRSSFTPKPATALTPTEEITTEGCTQLPEAAAQAAAHAAERTPGTGSTDCTKRAVPDAAVRTGKRRAVCATPPSSEDDEQAGQATMARPCKQAASWTTLCRQTTTRFALCRKARKVAQTSASWLSCGLLQRQILLRTSASLGPSMYQLLVGRVGRPHRRWVYCFPHALSRRLPFTFSDDEDEDGAEVDLVVLPSSSPSTFVDDDDDAESGPEFDPFVLIGSPVGSEKPFKLDEPEQDFFFGDLGSETAPLSKSMPANSKRKPAAPAATRDPYGPSGHATKAMKALKKAPSECSCLCSAFLSLDVCVTAGRCVSDSGGSSVI